MEAHGVLCEVQCTVQRQSNSLGPPTDANTSHCLPRNLMPPSQSPRELSAPLVTSPRHPCFSSTPNPSAAPPRAPTLTTVSFLEAVSTINFKIRFKPQDGFETKSDRLTDWLTDGLTDSQSQRDFDFWQCNLPTHCFWVSRESSITSGHYFLYSAHRVFLLMGAHCVLCEVRT